MASVKQTNMTRKTPKRPHFIAEWMETMDLSAADLARATGVDKSNVSRWINDGSCPNEEWQIRLGEYFKCGRDGLFVHPTEAWIKKFIAGRQKDEVERIKAMLATGFPEKKR
jgi:hypothetical protein